MQLFQCAHEAPQASADLEPFDQGTYDGVQYEYVYLTADGGRRVFMNNPPTDERDPHARLVAVLASLVED